MKLTQIQLERSFLSRFGIYRTSHLYFTLEGYDSEEHGGLSLDDYVASFEDDPEKPLLLNDVHVRTTGEIRHIGVAFGQGLITEMEIIDYLRSKFKNRPLQQ